MSQELDEKLGSILEVIKKSTVTSEEGTRSSDIVTPPHAETMGARGLEKLIANEMMYHQLLPPVTPALVQKAEKSARESLRALKALSTSPRLQKQISDMTPLIESEKERNNRSAPQEAELKGIIDEIMTEVSNTKGERVLPVGFVAAVGYLSAGAGVGGAVGVIAHKVYDWVTD